MKNRKVMLFLVLLLSFCTLFLSAGGEKESTEAGDDMYVIKMLSSGYGGMGSATPVGKVITDKFNVDFQFDQFTGNWQEKASLWLAAGDYPEIVYVQQDMQILRKYINSGAFVALDDLIETTAPNFKSFYKDQIPYYRANATDGKIYYWASGSPEEMELFQKPFEMAVRTDLFEKTGYDADLPLTEDEWLDFFVKAKEAAEEIDGRKPVGFTMPLGEPWAVALLPAAMRVGKYQYLGGGKMLMLDGDTNEIEYMLRLDYSKQVMRFFNKLYREGAFDKESFTDKSAQTTEKFNSGLALGAFYVTWFTGGANSALKSADKDYRYAVLPFRLKAQEENNDIRYHRTKTVRIFDMYGITKNARFPKRIMEVLNYTLTWEGQKLIGWGQEGIHYNVADGKRVPSEEFLNGYENEPQYLVNQGIGGNQFLFLGLAFGRTPNGQPSQIIHDPTIRFQTYSQELKNFYKSHAWENDLDPWNDIETRALSTGDWSQSIVCDPSSVEAKIEQRIKDLHNDTTVKLIMAADDNEFELIWNQAGEQLEELDADRVIDLYEKQYAEWIEKLGK